ncbi:MAG TPA: carbohydrate ABC transporter permease, partial [Bacillota bacterium]
MELELYQIKARKKPVYGKQILTYLILTLIAIITLVPLAWALSSSLKTHSEIYAFPPQWIPKVLNWSNYVRAWTMVPFGRFLLNSLYMSSTVTIMQLIVSSLAAYAFARLRFPGRDTLFLLYLGAMMIPGQVLIIPNFILMRFFGWIDSYKALILPEVFNMFTIFCTFLLRQYFLTLPGELEDAAKIDGCSRFQTFIRIIMPLSKPALATVAIFAFKDQWNNFLWPLIVINTPEKMPIQVGLTFFRGEFNTEWEVLLAGTIIALIPVIILFLFGQKYFVKGFSISG